jgi:hypothetical protein
VARRPRRILEVRLEVEEVAILAVAVVEDRT